MPGGDRTGPMGAGAMTGRAAGLCVGNSALGNITAGTGRGYGMGRGRGMGRGIRGGQVGVRAGWVAPYGAVPTGAQELEMLKSQAEEFQGALTGIQQRISEMESDSKGKK